MIDGWKDGDEDRGSMDDFDFVGGCYGWRINLVVACSVDSFIHCYEGLISGRCCWPI